MLGGRVRGALKRVDLFVEHDTAVAVHMLRDPFPSSFIFSMCGCEEDIIREMS